MATIVDMHVHTTRGSGDSRLSPEQAVARARELGINGLCISEHSGTWDRDAFQDFASRNADLLLVRALEATTEAGHLVVLGLERRLGPIVPFVEIVEEARRAAAFVILAHPFRNLHKAPPFNRPELYSNGYALPTTVSEAAAHPAFHMVDTIEAANGGNSEADNLSALRVARYLGLQPNGASDAHSLHELGSCATVFEDELRSESDLLEALRARRFHPARLLPSGEYVRFVDMQLPPTENGL